MSGVSVRYFSTIKDLKLNIKRDQKVIGCIQCPPDFIKAIFTIARKTTDIATSELDKRFELYTLDDNNVIINTHNIHHCGQLKRLFRMVDLMFVYANFDESHPKLLEETACKESNYDDDMYIMYITDAPYVPRDMYMNWKLNQDQRPIPIKRDMCLQNIDDITKHLGEDIIDSIYDVIGFPENQESDDCDDCYVPEYDANFINQVSAYLHSLATGFLVEDADLLRKSTYDDNGLINYIYDHIKLPNIENHVLRNVILHVIEQPHFIESFTNSSINLGNIKLFQIAMFFFGGIADIRYQQDTFTVSGDTHPKRLMPYLVSCLKKINHKYTQTVNHIINKYDVESRNISSTPVFNNYCKHDDKVLMPDIDKHIDIEKFIIGFDQLDSALYAINKTDKDRVDQYVRICTTYHMNPRNTFDMSMFRYIIDTNCDMLYNSIANKQLPSSVSFYHIPFTYYTETYNYTDFVKYVTTTTLPRIYPIVDMYIEEIDAAMNKK